MAELPPITVAEEDYNRLSTLLERVAGQSDVADGLEDELSRADMKPLADMPEGVVTMNSRVRFLNEDTGEEHFAHWQHRATHETIKVHPVVHHLRQRVAEERAKIVHVHSNKIHQS